MQRVHHLDDTAADRVTRAEFEALKASVAAQGCNLAILMRAAAASTIRQAEVEARDLVPLKMASIDSGYSESSIRKWFKSGLKAERIGGRVYISRRALAAFVAHRPR